MALTLHGNNGLGTTNGTAAAPSLAAPDSDTGFYFGTNLIHATTGGTERLRITGDGPHLLLGGTADVNEITESSANAGMVIGGTGFGNGGLAIINSTTGAGRIYFGDATGSNAARQRGQINYYHSGDYMMFATAGGERLRITSGGHVLIGDEGNDNAFFKAHAADGEADDLYVGQFINAEATAGRNYGLNIQGGSNSTDHGFRVKNHAGSVQLLVRGDGNVGINETSPDNKLHVTTTNSTAYSTNTSNTQNITNALLKLQNLDGSDGGGVNNYVGIHFAVANGATSHAQLNYARTGDNAGAFQFKARNTGSVYPNLMTIKSNGLVGINSTSPAAYLDIGAHGTATPTLHVRNHTAAGSFSGNYGSEFRHSFNSVNHAMLIHTQEASDARRVLDISDSNGIFATFTNGKVGIGVNAPVAPLHI